MGPLLIPARCAIFTAGLDDVEQWKSGYWYGSLVEFLLTFHNVHFDSVLTVLTAVKVFVIVLCNTHSTGMLLCCSATNAAERAPKLGSWALLLRRCTPAPWLVM